MAMFDRRKAPWIAQAASFGVVLIIGLFTHHSSGPATIVKPSPSPKASVSASTPQGTQAGGSALTVQATEVSVGVPFKAPAVTVAAAGRPAVRLGAPAQNSQGIFTWTKNLAAGPYRVCVTPPPDWMVVGSNCSTGSPGSPPVAFHLTPKPTSITG